MSKLPEYPFIMEPEDRFVRVLVSNPVHFIGYLGQSAVICFFVIRRGGSGMCDVVNVHKTFDGGQAVSRTVQQKTEIPPQKIEEEIAAIMNHFTAGILEEAGIQVKWNNLDLSDLSSQEEQLEKLRTCPFLSV